MRKLKYLITYDAFIKNLEQFPNIIGDNKEAMNDGGEWGVIHGDVWTGNHLFKSDYDWQVTSSSVLISESQQPTEEAKLFVVDWEFVQFGHGAYEIG
ncbi:hypothetical protein F4818DRAFT_439525 [Hypoxylon cercidicola]|nr:hypothetical protein F4818DRAFT_439525 [Hypoxylon cercidicola]